MTYKAQWTEQARSTLRILQHAINYRQKSKCIFFSQFLTEICRLNVKDLREMQLYTVMLSNI